MFWTKKGETEEKKEVAVAAPKVSTRKGVMAKLHDNDYDNPPQAGIDLTDFILSNVDQDIAEIYGKFYYCSISHLNVLLIQIARHLGKLCANIENAGTKIGNSDGRKNGSGDGDDPRQPVA